MKHLLGPFHAEYTPHVIFLVVQFLEPPPTAARVHSKPSPGHQLLPLWAQDAEESDAFGALPCGWWDHDVGEVGVRSVGLANSWPSFSRPAEGKATRIPGTVCGRTAGI